MKPTKSKARKILFEELKKKIKREEEKIDKLRRGLFDLASGDVDIEISSHKDQWYLGVIDLVYTFIDK